jgi:sugar/nucleoside kinase (ribokinase family)
MTDISRKSGKYSKPRVIGCGLVALDIVFGLDTCNPKYYAGGTCGNVLIGLSYLGWSAYPLARLNGDPASVQIREDLSRWEVNLDFAELGPHSPTPVVIQRLRLDGEGRIRHQFSMRCPHCRGFLPQYQPVPRYAILEALEQMVDVEVMFADRLSPGTVALAEAAYERGALIFFEVSARCDPRLFARMLAVSHIIKYSTDQVGHLPTNQSRMPTVPLEIETLGARGLRYRGTIAGSASRSWKTLPPYPVEGLRDSAGAGDWSTVGILNSLCQAGSLEFEGLPIDIVEDGLMRGQALGAWTCGYEGARGGMYAPTSRNVVKQIASDLTNSRDRRVSSHQHDDSLDLLRAICLECASAPL